MLSEYAFLNDHSYSLRPNVDDDDELPLGRREDKRVPVNRAYINTISTNRTVSIDRSSSDKENTSLISSISTSMPTSTSAASTNARAATKNARARKKKTPIGSRLSARSQTGKKPPSKANVKSSRTGGVNKKKKTVVRGKPKPLGFHQTDSSDAPSLSIEERVKLRRTTPSNTGASVASTSSVSNNKFDARRQMKSLARTAGQTVQQDLKQIRGAMSSKPALSTTKLNKHHTTKKQSSVKSQKMFLGSGLDLDNIVLGNRQRRSVPH